MPFTPLHFGPMSTLAFSLKGRLDLPVFLLANIIIDMEPLTVMLLQLNIPEHAVFHSFTVGGLLGVCWGFLAYGLRRPITRMMMGLKLPYEPGLKKAIVAGILGVWSNVILDAILYPEIKLLYPLEGNPLYGLMATKTLVLICAFFFIPAVILYRKASRQQ